MEFVLLLSFVDSASGHVEEALASLEELIVGFPSLIVQSTRGLLELKVISLYFSLFVENNSLEASRFCQLLFLGRFGCVYITFILVK